MFLHFLLIATYLGTTCAQQHSACPESIQMQFCGCRQISKILYVVCENVGEHQVLEDLASVTEVEKPMDLTFHGVDLGNLTYSLLEGLEFNHLDIQYCNLSFVEPDAFINVTDTLERLSLSNNVLKAVPSEALKILTHLKYLYLDYNELNVLHNHSFEGLRSLRTLSLRGNLMKIVEDSAFVGIGNNFKELNLGQNDFTAVPAAALNNIDSLRTLKLHANKIASLRPEDSLAMESLTQLSLAGNRIQRVPRGAFRGLKNLILLDLSGNVINCIHPHAFHGLEDKLRHLKLHFNRLPEVPAESLMNMSQLEFIFLHENNITDVRKDDFQPYGRMLKKIYLQNNSIRSVDPMAFMCLKSLQSLFLGSNQLTTAPFETYAPFLDRLTDIDLHGNPFHCDCDVSWLRDWMNGNRSTVVVSLNMTRCSSPEELSGIAIEELTEDQLFCPNATSKPFQSCEPKTIASNSHRLSSDVSTIILQISVIYITMVFGWCRLP